MSALPQKNAIQRRLEQFESTWSELIGNADARLLRLVLDDDGAQMWEVFLQWQNEEESENADLFLPFREPFTDAGTYGRVLRASLIEQYEEIREGIAAEGIPADWQCPPWKEGRSEIANFLHAAGSLLDAYQDLIEHFAVVLLPESISDASQWCDWLQRLAARPDVPPQLRLVVIDSAAAPALDNLAQAQPQRVLTASPNLDMPGAYAELVRGIPGNGPGFAFRRLFVALTHAAALGNVAAAAWAAQRAETIAVQQNWPLLASAVNMALGSTYLAAGDVARTLACYRSANAAVAGSSEPGAATLDLQTRFAEASALIADNRYADAAEVYERIGPLAEQQGEAIARLEAWRMAAWCREANGEKPRAWRRAAKALEAGDAMDASLRPDSTLPYVGQLMLRLIADGICTDQEEMVRRRMIALVGKDWEERIELGAASS